MKTGSLEGLAVAGVDIGKDKLHPLGFDHAGQMVMRKQIRRFALNVTFEALPRCVVGSEACPSAHFVSRARHGLGFEPRFANCGEDVVQTLERFCRQVGYLQTIRVDNCSEFNSRDLDFWAYANDVTLDFSRPGKPTDNGFIEAFDSNLRKEYLNARWFLDPADARETLKTRHRDYIEVRPHSAIEYNVPIELHNPGGATRPPP